MSKNNVALITGSANSIGKAMGIKLTSLGAKILITVYKEGVDFETVKEIQNPVVEAIFIKTNFIRLR